MQYSQKRGGLMPRAEMSAAKWGRVASDILSRMPSLKPAKKLFLVDAMGFIFRAFFAPMERLRSPTGMPTKVPYLFVQMLRRLMRDFQPDYLGFVFDLPEPTSRENLFAEYKAKRPPMPEDLAMQLPDRKSTRLNSSHLGISY